MTKIRHTTATRNTCFLLIASIEQDLRDVFRKLATGKQIPDLLPADVREKAGRRLATDLTVFTVSDIDGDIDLLDYLDFDDLAQLLNRHKNCLEVLDVSDAKALASRLQQTTKRRNRVCHSRPLEADDLPALFDLATEVCAPPFEQLFKHTSSTLEAIKNAPETLVAAPIPAFWRDAEPALDNNLPLPDFDETGFLGRRDDRKRVLELLLSHHPVVTVVGEGGVGKTALALRCLYDIVEKHPQKFDAIVWVSAKTKILTPRGAQEISQAISSTLVLDTIGEHLGTKTETGVTLNAIHEYLDAFRILLAIDNLETLSEGSLRDLVRNVPRNSKVLLTSRVGLGEIEIRYALDALDPRTSATLMRSSYVST